MKAAILEAFGKALAIDDVPDPKVGTGEVLVNVLATVIPPYAAEIFSGKRRYPLEPPVISGVGAIGRGTIPGHGANSATCCGGGRRAVVPANPHRFGRAPGE